MTTHRNTAPTTVLLLSLALMLSTLGMPPTPAAAQVPGVGDTASLLPREASVRIGAAGLQQIPLGAAVLTESHPDLRDVRLFDGAGNEVPWLLAAAMPVRPTVAAVALVPTEATQELRESEFQRPTHYESFVVELPAVPTGATGWDIVLATDEQELTRRYTVIEVVDGSGPIQRGEGTVFRFLGPLRQRLTIPLGVGAGTFAVTLEGEGSNYLTPTFSAMATRPRTTAPTVDVPLTIENVDHEGGETVLTFRRPRGLVPSKIQLRTSTTTFHRRVQVRDLGPGSEARDIGDGVIYRIPELDGAAELDVRLGPAQGDLLQVRIADGDAQALEDLRVTAVIEQPILIAHLEGDATLRFGGGRLRPPRYDLQRLARTALGRDLARHELPQADVSQPRPNPSYDHRPALGWAMHPGADVESFLYRSSRTLLLDPGIEGLSRVRLTAEDLAALEATLSDLRVADLAGHQWPYLVEEDAANEDVVRYPDREAHEDGSEYVAVFAAGDVPVERVTIRTTAAFVDRDFVLYGQIGEEPEEELTRGRLSRRPDSDDELHIATRGARTQRLRLVVHDGGDAPLPDLEIVAGVPVPDLYVAAPAGDYRLLLGNPEVPAPTYEVRRARELMLSVPAGEAQPGPLLSNPDYLPPRRPLHLEDWLLWAVLILSILVLAALTLRATRNETPEGTPGETAQATPEGGQEGGQKEGPEGGPVSDPADPAGGAADV
ncbi:MAG: hypothetical protein DRJ42_18680 [Deltaproteobacteria bacterium]|nr:MAG: hypothetical protein DRJ42_18680 [Deltaproteobacteria bacterium]